MVRPRGSKINRCSPCCSPACYYSDNDAILYTSSNSLFLHYLNYNNELMISPPPNRFTFLVFPSFTHMQPSDVRRTGVARPASSPGNSPIHPSWRSHSSSLHRRPPLHQTLLRVSFLDPLPSPPSSLLPKECRST